MKSSMFASCLVFLVSQLSLPAITLASCPPGGCGPYGDCVMDTRSCGDSCEERCVCIDGFAGRDCSFRYELCPDDVGPNSVRACFNGGTCYKTEDYKGATEATASNPDTANSQSYTYSCDCSAAFGDSIMYAGHQCEYPGEISCEIGKSSSDYAFCVNGGTCKQMVNSGEKFHGCNCNSVFEGRHCQFPAGTAPKREMVLYPTSTTDMGMGVPAIMLLCMVVLGVAGAAVFFTVKRKRQAKYFNSRVDRVTVDGEDLQLEEIDMNDDDLPESLSPNKKTEREIV